MPTRLPSGPPGWIGPHALVGKSVCFTGSSVCTVYGFRLTRFDQERLAEDAGLIIAVEVRPGLDILVMGRPNLSSGKARRAAAAGVQVMAERDFWLAVGLPIDPE